jgi:RNA polymerase sigma-70 factor (ECF subfamily)
VTEPELVRRMTAGDEAAFAEFFDAFFPGLFRFAMARLGRDEDAAEEVVQAALARAVVKIHTFRGEAALFTWLCTFCRHEIGNWLRTNRRRARSVELAEEVPEIRAALESLAREPAPGSEEALQRAEVARRVQVTLDALPRRYGDALEWKYVEGLTVEEIAVRLGLGSKATESLLGRARQAFREGFRALATEA